MNVIEFQASKAAAITAGAFSMGQSDPMELILAIDCKEIMKALSGAENLTNVDF